MFHVVRGPQGAIVSVHRDPVDGAELLPPNHPEVLAFFGASETRSFAAMDADLVRVLEDLIDVLLRRNVFRITDLPLEAQVKLFERKHFRENLQAHALSLYGGQAPTFTPGSGTPTGPEVLPSDLMPLDWPTDGMPR